MAESRVIFVKSGYFREKTVFISVIFVNFPENGSLSRTILTVLSKHRKHRKMAENSVFH